MHDELTCTECTQLVVMIASMIFMILLIRVKVRVRVIQRLRAQFHLSLMNFCLKISTLGLTLKDSELLFIKDVTLIWPKLSRKNHIRSILMASYTTNSQHTVRNVCLHGANKGFQ